MRNSTGMTPLRGHFDQVQKAIATASQSPLVPREARLALLSLCGLLDGMLDRIERFEEWERREHWRNG